MFFAIKIFLLESKFPKAEIERYHDCDNHSNVIKLDGGHYAIVIVVGVQLLPHLFLARGAHRVIHVTHIVRNIRHDVVVVIVFIHRAGYLGTVPWTVTSGKVYILDGIEMDIQPD